jgi:hypothetical protein
MFVTRNKYGITNSQSGRDRVRGNCQQSQLQNNPIVSLQEMPGVEYIVDRELVLPRAEDVRYPPIAINHNY